MKPNRSVSLFIVLVFALSLPLYLLESLVHTELLPKLPLSSLGVLCPFGAAFILIYRTEGSEGSLRWLKRAFDYQRVSNKLLYIPVFFTLPLITLVSYQSAQLQGRSLPAFSINGLPLLILFFVFLLAAMAEELGWSGYATEPLQQRFGALSAALILGIVWALWHVIPLLQVERSMVWIAWWALATVSYRVIMVWLFNQTNQSVFAVSIFHATINLCWQLFPIQGSFYDPKTTSIFAAIFALVLCLLYYPHTRLSPN